jgi:hypothetical protein
MQEEHESSLGHSGIDFYMINALACLFIAAKNIEIDTQLPHSSKYLELLPPRLRRVDRNAFYEAELSILQELGWDCQQMTTFV